MPVINRYHVGPRLSEIVVHGNTVYLSGQIARDLDKDTQGQTAEALESIDFLLAEVGSDKRRILSATVYLADFSDYDAMNEAWQAWIPHGHTPARVTIPVGSANHKCKVVIAVIAAL